MQHTCVILMTIEKKRYKNDFPSISQTYSTNSCNMAAHNLNMIKNNIFFYGPRGANVFIAASLKVAVYRCKTCTCDKPNVLI